MFVFPKFKILTVAMVHESSAKCLCVRSNRCLDLAICNFQNMVRPPLCIFRCKILYVVWTQRVKIRHLRNFLAMGQTVAKLW